MQGMIVDWIAHNAHNLPEKTATIELPSNRRLTYAEMHERVGRVASWLISLGVKPGDRVGLLALNSLIRSTSSSPPGASAPYTWR